MSIAYLMGPPAAKSPPGGSNMIYLAGWGWARGLPSADFPDPSSLQACVV